MKRFALIPILVFFAFLVPSRERAFAEGGIAWDPQGMPISEAPGEQVNIRMVLDGSGGAIIVWEDHRIPTDSNIYAQRIDKDGNRLWDPDGMAVCTDPTSQEHPVIVGDGSGGAFIAWQDYRDGTGYPYIYAVRISSTGVTWPDVKLRDVGLVEQSSPEIVEAEILGVNGAVIVWAEKGGVNQYIYAQAIKDTGSLPWSPTGVEVSSGTSTFQGCPKIIRSDSNNVIVTWEDQRNVSKDIYAQQIIISSGTVNPSWTVNGNPVTEATNHQERPEIVSDGSGGAIITWTDWRDTATRPDIYAQRIDSNGARLWTPLDGVPICTKDEAQSNPVITEDLLNGATVGAIIVWEDMRSGDFDIYAEKVARDDPPVFLDEEDTFVAGGFGLQLSPRIVSDNAGGGIGTWIENYYKIFATRRNQDGQPVWSSYPGVLVCEGTGIIIDSQIISDDSGGAIVAWVALGSGGDFDIFAQRVIDDSVTVFAPISGRVTRSDEEKPITGVEVEALKDDELVSSDFTNTYGYYELTVPAIDTYMIRATWIENDIESSVSKQTIAPSYNFDFTLEIDYELGTIAGNVSGVEEKYVASLCRPESNRISGSELQKILSPGNGIAFVELEQRDKVIVRVPVEMEGDYSIPNLLPGRFIARAYNGTIYSNPRTVNLKEGETFKVNFVFGIMPGETVFNYPNPAKKGSTTIRYYCGYSDPEAEIKIYNIAGELVRGVRDSEIDDTDAPIYKFLWDCKNDSGKGVASSIYIYIVEVKEKSSGETKKVIKRLAVIR